MIPDFSGDFLNFDGTNDGDIVTIIGKGKVEYNEVLKKNIFNVQVEHNGKTKVYSPSNAAGIELQKTFGKDADEWVGKQFEVLHVDKKLKIRPLKTTKI
jgi:hypothetical protein